MASNVDARESRCKMAIIEAMSLVLESFYERSRDPIHQQYVIRCSYCLDLKDNHGEECKIRQAETIVDELKRKVANNVEVNNGTI